MDPNRPPSDQSHTPAQARPEAGAERSAPAFLRKPDFRAQVQPRAGLAAPRLPSGRQPAAAGAVLRREPPQPEDGARPGPTADPADWRVAPLPSRIVDNPARPAFAAPDFRRPASRIVDNADRTPVPPGEAPDGVSALYDGDEAAFGTIALSDIVDKPEDPAAEDSHYLGNATISSLRGPKAYRPQGRSGPDEEVVRILREAKKQQLVDRAAARGRDPNAGAKEVVKGVTRSAKTQEDYLARGNQLLARYRRERRIRTEDLLSLDTMEFVDWVLSLKPALKPTTWRPYKQSVIAVLGTIPDSEQAVAVLQSDTVESGSEPERKSQAKEKATASGKRSSLPRRTSAMKAKLFPKPDFDRMVNYFRYFSASKYGQALADWLVAGIATGLRPGEWMATEVEVTEDKAAPRGRWAWLYVLNAKATNNRGNGAARTIDLSNVTDPTLEAIRRMSDRGRDWLIQGTFDDAQTQCAALMYNTAQRMFPAQKLSYSLYSLRHQFIANAKSYRLPEEVSAMAGHLVTNTAIENYGKKRSAWNPEDIEDRAGPAAEEVATVQRRHVFYEERQALLRQVGLDRPSVPGQRDD